MSEATAVGMQEAKGESQASETARKRILVTGGAGYIGSHTTVKLLEAGFDVTILDNLCNSSLVSVQRIKELASVGDDRVSFHKVDLMDAPALEAAVRAAGKVSAVVHFAALKAVGESVEKPLKYYENNMVGTFNLLRAMEACDISTIVFSSSATVYGDAAVPITEASTIGVGITNPYGWTKSMMEQVLRDVQRANPHWRVVLLRYFNPVGAHPSGRIGEDPKGRPNNLMPFVQQVAVGRRDKLSVFGNDYDTVDGTGVRDYIHVVDLAEGHLAAISYADKQPAGFCEPFNLGTGNGYSVLQMVEAMKKASGREIPYEIVPRREGDLATVYAEPTKAREKLGWEAKLGLEEMCADAWRWQSTNPNGFGTGDDAEE